MNFTDEYVHKIAKSHYKWPKNQFKEKYSSMNVIKFIQEPILVL